MNDFTENSTDELTNETPKVENPLSVRVGPYYKDKFNELIKKTGLNKKMLMESIILQYYMKDKDNKREELLPLSNEINLISTGFDELLKIFGTIATKAQDTLASQKSSYEQQISILKSKIDELQLANKDLHEKNSLLTETNEAVIQDRNTRNAAITNLQNSLKEKDSELNSLKIKNGELLEQLNTLRNIEKDNLTLQTELQKERLENKRHKDSIAEKNLEIQTLQNKCKLLSDELADYKNKTTIEIKDIKESIAQKHELETTTLKSQITALTDTINTLKKTKEQELSEIEKRIRKDAELDKKADLLEAKEKYNTLQNENLKLLNELNQKNHELFSLKSQLENIKNNNQL